MRDYSPSTTTALAADAVIVRGMVLFDFPSGRYGFWEGEGPLVWNTITFQGGGQLIEARAAAETTAMQSSAIELSLYENPALGLSADILQTIEAESYHQRPVTIYRAVFDPVTLALVSVDREWSGLIDRVEHVEGADRYGITAHCESLSLDYTKRGWAIGNGQQQEMVSTGDKFFEFVGVAGKTEIYFGRKLPKNKKAAGSGANL